MKVLLTKKFFQQDLDYIQERILEGIELIQPKDFSEEALSESVEQVEILLGSFVSDQLLQKAKNLKLIQVPWTGVDNLDYEILSRYEVPIANSHSNAGIVAEHAIALMYDAAKRLSYHDKALRKGIWNRPKNDKSNKVSPFSIQIKNAKIGMIGFGSIGKAIYQYLSGLDCEFKVFNRTGEGATLGNLKYYPIENLKDEIKEINIFFVCIALTEQTKNLLNQDFFVNIQSDAILINVSRGEVINEKALYHHLVNHPNFFAGIDTWYNYPNVENPEVFPSKSYNFHELDNLIMSPHRAGMISNALPHLDDAIQNLNRVYIGEEPINLISLNNKY